MSKQSPTLYDKVDDGIVKILKYVSYISSVCLIAIMFVAFFNVLGEKIFHKGIPASTEIIQYLHIPVVFLACGYHCPVPRHCPVPAQTPGCAGHVASGCFARKACTTYIIIL